MDAIDPWIHGWITHLGGFTAESFLKLILAAALGGLVGLEREIRGREAGFRTNILVSLGSALAMIVSNRLAAVSWTAAGAYNINVDPGRIAYGVMTGVGFLGAGAILKQGASVRGLTTAAGLWCVAAVGLACGLGLYMLSVLASLLVLAALWLLNVTEFRLPRLRYQRLVIRMPWTGNCVAAIAERCRQAGMDVVDKSFKRTDDLSAADVSLVLSYNRQEKYDAFERELAADANCKLMASERA